LKRTGNEEMRMGERKREREILSIVKMEGKKKRIDDRRLQKNEEEKKKIREE
jgi:hypothetical protein